MTSSLALSSLAEGSKPVASPMIIGATPPRSSSSCCRWQGSFSRAVYSDCASNLLMYLGTESAVSSEKPLKSLGIRADFDSTVGGRILPLQPAFSQ